MQSATSTLSERRPLILLLEDSTTDAELIWLQLDQGNLRCDQKWVTSRTDFEKALTGRFPDLILCDNRLPGFSGLEALELTRQKSPLVPFIVVTGALGDEAAVEFIKAGATDYILKDRLYRLNPAVFRALREVEKYDEGRRAEKQNQAFAKLSQRLSVANTPAEAAKIILEIADDLLGWDAAYIDLLSRSNAQWEQLLTVDTRDGKRVIVASPSRLHQPTPMMREVLQGRPQLVDPSSGFGSEIPLVPFGNEAQKSESRMFVPIDSGGKVLGILSVQSYTAGTYSPEELNLLQTLADQCGDALRRIEMTEALRAAEAKYHSIFENATEGIFQTTPEGRYLSANPALARMFGYEMPEELMVNISDIERQTYVVPEKRDEFKKLIAKAGSVRQFEVERYRRDGTTFWISINAHSIRDAGGNIIYFEGTNQDISERKRAEAVLRESEERFRALFESAPIGIALHDASGHFLQVNEAYQRMVGYTEKELKGLEPRKVTHPEDVEAALSLLKELRSGQRNQYERDKRLLRRDGKIVWAHSSVSSLRDRDGNLRYIISMVEDITDEHQAASALRESERRLRLIANNTTDVIFAFDMFRNPLYANPAVEALTGYTFAEIQERKFIDWIHPEDRERMIAKWESLYSGESYGEIEFRLVTRTGVIKWCSSTWGPLFDEKGKQIGVQGRERDITDRKELEREVLESTANERRRIGHELHDGLGQYLAGIAFKTKALEQNLASRALEYSREAGEIADLVSNAIRQTRNLARGFDPIEVESIGLSAALQNLAAETRNFFGTECHVLCDDPMMEIHPQRAMSLYRIAQEAIHNSIKHGDCSNIRISLRNAVSSVQLQIRDDGNGFDTRKDRELGMGLRVMGYRARSMGGDLKILSHPGGGTEISCIVPGFRQSPDGTGTFPEKVG